MTYIGDDIQFPLLIPNLLVLCQAPIIPNEDPTDNENKGVKKRHWERGRSKYLTSLCKRLNLKLNKKKSEIKVGEVIAIKSDERIKAQ